MCGGSKSSPPPPPAPPPPAAPPPVEVVEPTARREQTSRDLGRETRSETRRVDAASAQVTGDGSGLRL